MRENVVPMYNNMIYSWFRGAYKQANKGKQSKGPSGVKDLQKPDLWIHHDTMELKNIDKSGNDSPDSRNEVMFYLRIINRKFFESFVSPAQYDV